MWYEIPLKLLMTSLKVAHFVDFVIYIFSHLNSNDLAVG